MQSINTIQVYDTIKSLFAALEECNSLDSVNAFVASSNLSEQIKTFQTKYPLFDFSLTKSDINHLININVLNDDHTLNSTNFPSDPLCKLLAAVLWKNGDIKKVQHIVDGILEDSKDRSEYSLIFKQYGASLANESEPIVDQHVLRAFEIYSIEPYSEELVEKSRQKSLFKTKDKGLLDRYRNWFKQLVSKVPVSDRAEFSNIIDKVIFIYGKGVKR
jgi:hypothetical protein